MAGFRYRRPCRPLRPDHDLRPGLLGHQPDAALDLVGDVRDHLDGAAQVITTAFLADHLGIHLTGGEIAEPAQADIDEAFVVTQVQVGFSAVVQHIDFTVLVG